MAISDSLSTAYKRLLHAIPKPLTAEEEAERARTGKRHPDIDPAALYDVARRFVDALSTDVAATAELKRRGTLCAKLTDDGSEYSLAAKAAQTALAGWDLSAQFADHPVYRDFLQKTVRTLLNAAGAELVAEVRGTYAGIKRLLSENVVPPVDRPVMETWRDVAWAIVSHGENDSLDGCYWLLHADKLQYAIFVPAAAPEIRQAAEALVIWIEPTAGRTAPPKRRGPKKADYDTQQKEAAVAAAWQRAHDARTYKGDFARNIGMKVSDFDRLLDRVAARKKSSE